MIMIPVRDEKAIECMRRCNKALGVMLDELSEMIRPGITTSYLNDQAEKLIKKLMSAPKDLATKYMMNHSV